MADIINEILESKSLYGKKIYLIGTALYGPVNTIIKASGISHVISVFGTEGSLIDAYRIIVETKVNCDVYLIKTSGIHSELYLDINQPLNDIVEKGFCLKAKHANEMYDNVSIILNDNSLCIKYINNSKDDYLLEYSYDKYLTLHDLAEAINDDTRNLKSEVYCTVECNIDTPTVGSLNVVNPSVNNLYGGNSGIYYNKNMMYTCLENTLSFIEGEDIDLIIPLNMNYDDTFTDDMDAIKKFYDLNREYLTLKDLNGKYLSYYSLLLSFCKKQMSFGQVTSGIMGLNLINQMSNDMTNYIDMLKYMKKNNAPNEIDKKYMHLVSVVVGDLYGVYGTSISNGYIAYATLIASLEVLQSTTNKMLPKTFSLANVFSQDILNQLMNLGFTSFRYSTSKKGVVVSSGITTSDNDSFKLLCNVRMIQLTMCYVRKLLSSFIGEDISDIVDSKSLAKNLKLLLDSLVSMKIITGYAVNELINPITGHIFLDLSLKTAYMIEEIRSYTGLSSKV